MNQSLPPSDSQIVTHNLDHEVNQPAQHEDTDNDEPIDLSERQNVDQVDNGQPRARAATVFGYGGERENIRPTSAGQTRLSFGS